MDSAFLKATAQKLLVQRSIFLFFSAVLSVAVVLLALLLFFKKERVVIVPTSGPSLWIEDSRVSEGYMDKMGFFLADILLNRSPSDVDKKNQVILEHVHPMFYHEIKKQLQAERASIIKNNQSYFFRTERSYADLSTNSYITEGEFLVLIGKSGEMPCCAQRERKKYILVFQCQGGRLLLTSLKKEGV